MTERVVYQSMIVDARAVAIRSGIGRRVRKNRLLDCCSEQQRQGDFAHAVVTRSCRPRAQDRVGYLGCGGFFARDFAHPTAP
jgi:hypothetical protein